VNDTLLELKGQGLGAMIVSHDHAAVKALADRVLEVSEGKGVLRAHG
jgi:ABC-type polar amino acid transport system ATPase subunit